MNYIIIGALLAGGYMLFKLRNGQASQSSDFQNIDVADAKKLIKNKQVTVLDVRTPMETASGTISKAKTINVTSPTFKKEVNKLDKDATYIVYCRSGRRSINACNIMAKEGFTKLFNLEGGYNAWK